MENNPLKKMKIKQFRYENVSPDGTLPNDGGAIGVNGGILNSMLICKNPKCHCSDGHWISIIAPRTEDGVVEGIKIEFDSLEEMLEHSPNTDDLKQLLYERKRDEYLKSKSNLIGLCLKPSSTSRYKILSVDDYSGDKLDVSIINVYKGSETASIRNDDSTMITVPIKVEEMQIITQKEFDEFLKEAYEMIINHKK